MVFFGPHSMENTVTRNKRLHIVLMSSSLVSGQRLFVNRMLEEGNTHIIKAMTGAGKTLLSTIYVAQNHWSEQEQQPHLILFVSMNKKCAKDHSSILDTVAHKLNKERGDDAPPIVVICTTAQVFWRFWKKDETDDKNVDMKKDNLNAFNEVLRDGKVTIIIDEIHTVVSSSNTVKCKKLAWLMANLPAINVIGATATNTADTPQKKIRLAKVICHRGDDEEPDLNISYMEEQEFTDIQKQLPFTPEAKIYKLAGITVPNIVAERWNDIAFLMSLNSSASIVEGVAPPDAQKCLREYIANLNNPQMVSKLLEYLHKNPTVEVVKCDKIDTSKPASDGSFIFATTGQLCTKAIKMACETLQNGPNPADYEDEEDADEEKVEEEERFGERGRICFIVSAIGKVALGKLKTTVQEALNEEDAEGALKYKIIDARNRDVPWYDVKKAAWEKKVVFVFAGSDMATGTNALVGTVDTIVEHGNFSDSGRTQFAGRVAKRPVTHGSKVSSVCIIRAQCTVMDKVDEHLRRMKEVNDPRETRQRKKEAEGGSDWKESFLNRALRMEPQFAFPSKIKQFLGNGNGMMAIHDDPAGALDRFRSIKKNLRTNSEEDEEDDDAPLEDITEQTAEVQGAGDDTEEVGAMDTDGNGSPPKKQRTTHHT